MRYIKSKNRAFTVVELILVVTIFTLLFAGTTVVIANLYGRQNLKNHGLRMVEDMREAHSNAVSQKNDSSWGIRLDTTANPNRYIYFKGASYASRTTSFDRIVVFPSSVIFDSISLNGGGSEVVFNQGTGRTTNYGSFNLITSDTADGVFSFSVNALGLIDYAY